MSHPPPDLDLLISAYLFLLITGGHVLLPVIITTALLHKKLSWHPTLINLCITWVIHSVIHCLYLYAREDMRHRYRTVCLVQAAMVYGTAPMVAVAGLGVVIHTWTTIQHFERTFAEKFPRWLCRFLIISITVYCVRRVFNQCMDFDKTTQPLRKAVEWSFLYDLYTTPSLGSFLPSAL
ncbi:uncharacterized protein EDB91DRAFT_256981 [Suillus paluster]|uniref:uncharacterized protein n=1 Tax=Suillus paluster TaxID=48578 RepID=UPI001B85BE8A|nr:uncharacterized protein EDB91DRAFT_256981 [Suillus paluster]KAG1754867.1 hypothetical protein EDB91DRAFT_256981 [Suillus paluster]